jgi:2-oxoglutarate ferredoxin oxidoreductase subunit alpha
MDSVKPFGLGNKEALALQEYVDAGAGALDVRPATASDRELAETKFAQGTQLAEANIAALNAGHA